MATQISNISLICLLITGTCFSTDREKSSHACLRLSLQTMPIQTVNAKYLQVIRFQATYCQTCWIREPELTSQHRSHLATLLRTTRRHTSQNQERRRRMRLFCASFVAGRGKSDLDPRVREDVNHNLGEVCIFRGRPGCSPLGFFGILLLLKPRPHWTTDGCCSSLLSNTG